MNFSVETINSRVSARSYSKEPLGTAERAALAKAMATCIPTPFGSVPRFTLLDAAAVPGAAGGRIGTYGVIKDAPAFLVGCVLPSPDAFIDYGYAMEGIVLAATAAGLGTCWLGGIFDRSGAAQALGLKKGEVVPAITPVGHTAERRSLADLAIRTAAGSGRRKSWDSLFFDGSFSLPLDQASAGPWAEALEALRGGPSASNKQPWRVVRTGAASAPAFHLHLEENRAYTRAIPGILLQDLDAGIAMRHLEAAARDLGLPGSWKRLSAPPLPLKDPMRYIATWSA